MGVKYRLSYCNKDATPLRLDIEDSSYSGAIIPIKAASNPFTLSMLNDSEFAKLGTIRATEASLEILSSDDFNIDILADNSETKLNVKFYFNNVLEWTGFVLPDFYQETINKDKIINITATDRLGILKDVPFPENYQSISLLDVVKTCLLETGLSLNIVTLIGYNAVGKSLDNRPLEVQVIGERLFNQNGDVLNCYDVLMSVLDTFNCFITQFRGKWHIINKQQLETGLGRLIEYNPDVLNNTIVSNVEFTRSVYNLDKVYSGGERVLRPVLSDVGLLGEFGGSILYPKNNNFRIWTGIEFLNWTPFNGFVQGTYYDNPIGYNGTTGKINAFVPGLTNKLNNNNTFPASGNPVNMNTQRYLQSDAIPIVLDSIQDGKVNIEYSFNITSRNRSLALFTIILETPDASRKYFLLNGSKGVFEYAGNTMSNLDHRTEGLPIMFNIAAGVARVVSGEISIDGDTGFTTAVQTTISGSTVLNSDIIDPLSFSQCKLYVRIYNVIDYIYVSIPSTIQSVVHNVNINIKSSSSLPKGNLYRATRSGNFTAKTDIKTSVFSDYLVRGLNGYFYSYPSDDSSIIQTDAFWTTNYDSNVLPVLQHSVRQISRMYANVQSDYVVTIREPRLSILDLMSIACKSESFVVSNYSIDYLRSQINLTASQITSATNPDSEFIYSYFGDEGGTNVSGLSSVGSGGAGGSGGSAQDLQQTLDRGNEGDVMIITESLTIPDSPPTTPSGNEIYVGSGATASPILSGSIIAGTNVAITGDLNNRLLGSGDITINASGGGGGSQDLESVLAQGSIAYNSGILLGGVGSGYGYRLRNGAEMYGHNSLQRIYLLASDGYYLASFTPATKQMLVVNPDSSVTYEAIPGGGGGGGSVTSVGLTVPTGFTVSNSPITSSGDISLSFASGYSLPSNSLQSTWSNKQDALTAGSGISIVGNVISSTGGGGGGGGTVTSVGMSMPTGFSVSNSPVTTNGTIGVTFASGYSLPTTAKQSQWDTAYTERHTHSNKANLDTINQNLSTTSNVQFNNVDVTSLLQVPNTSNSSSRALYIGSGATAASPEGTIASSTVLGGVKVGGSLSINPSTGVLDVNKIASNNNATASDATDLASAITLINQLKQVINDLQNKMRTSNILDS